MQDNARSLWEVSRMLIIRVACYEAHVYKAIYAVQGYNRPRRLQGQQQMP